MPQKRKKLYRRRTRANQALRKLQKQQMHDIQVVVQQRRAKSAFREGELSQKVSDEDRRRQNRQATRVVEEAKEAKAVGDPREKPVVSSRYYSRRQPVPSSTPPRSLEQQAEHLSRNIEFSEQRKSLIFSSNGIKATQHQQMENVKMI